MDESDTLFSLELAVESLRVHATTVTCRFPTVAVRLLDFPTLLLHHVDPEQAAGLRERLALDSFGEVPPQLAELRDHRGNYRLNRCKSSLFKMAPRSLLGHLRATPLYVMLIDVWPEVAKLVASCAVPLNQTVEKIAHDIEANGADIPAVHSHRESYKLYNLMGSEVGWVVVRHRLLSMGASLIPHVPQSALLKGGRESVDLSVTPRKSHEGVKTNIKTGPEKDIILDDLEVIGHPKTVSVAISTIEELNSDSKSAASKKSHQGTQTKKTQKKQETRHQKAFDGSIPTMPNNDLIINNTHCPPPLFFNTVYEDALSAKHNPSSVFRDVRTGIDSEMEDQEDLSENSTLVTSRTLSEDVIHQIETHYTFPSGEQSQSVPSGPSWSVRKTHRTTRAEKSRTSKSLQQQTGREVGGQEAALLSSEAGPHAAADVCGKCQRQLQPDPQARLPILSALLQELSLLHGNALPNLPPPPPPPTSTGVHVRSRGELPVKKKKEVYAESETGDGKENLGAHHPRGPAQAKTYRHKHRECAKPPEGVPATRGWLRQQRPARPSTTTRRRTKLQHGMTHSQRLRLRKNNPELLKELEAKEEEERRRMRERRQDQEGALLHQERPRQAGDEFAGDYDEQNDVSTEIAHHSDGEDQLAIHQNQMKFPSKRQDANQSDQHQQGGPHNSSVQPPAPAPRRRKGATFVWGEGKQQLQAAATAAVAVTSTPGNLPASLEREGRGHGGGKDGNRIENRTPAEGQDMSSSEKSGRSIDVYLPSASLQDADDSTDTDSQFSSESSFIHRPKVMQVPGLPPEGDVSSPRDLNRTDDESYAEYSDDFVGSDKLASTNEQELEPLKENRSSSDRSSVSSASEDSGSGSARTTKSRPAQPAARPQAVPAPRAGETLVKPQPRRLSIPKPKLSSISPVPGRKISKASTVSTAVLTPELPQDYGRSPTPPTPKPRSSLQRSASSFSENSLFRDTVPSSEFQTEDSQQASKTESEDSYSDNYSDSQAVSDQNNSF